MFETIGFKTQSQYNERHSLVLFTISSAQIATELCLMSRYLHPKIQFELPNQHNLVPLKLSVKLTTHARSKSDDSITSHS